MRRTFKLCLLQLARALGLFRLARWLTRRSITIVGWHGVSMGDEHNRLREYFVTTGTLRRRLQHLARHFQFATLDQALQQHASGRISGHLVVLTFDDGLYGFRGAAVDVLREFDASATVYALSMSVKQEAVAYPVLLRDLFHLSRLDEAPAAIAGLNGFRSLRTAADRERCAAAVRQVFDQLPARDQAAYLHQLAEALQVDFDRLQRQRVWSYLSAVELRELVAAGYDVQAHSHQHLTVTELGSRLEEDTATCRRLLEAALATPIRDYCYPSGHWRVAAWPALRAVGMRSAVTCKQGPNFCRTPALALRRCMDSEALSQLEFEAAVSGFRWLLHVALHPQRLYAPSEAESDNSSYF